MHRPYLIVSVTCLAAAAAFAQTPLPVTPVWTFDGSAAGDRHAAVVASAGDLDLDGIDDVFVGDPTQSFAELRSGRTGLQLWSNLGDPNSQYGASFARVGDVNGDGYPDVVVGAPGFTICFPCQTHGKLYVLSGHFVATQTGVQYLNVIVDATVSAGGQAGVALAGIADLDGDNVRDFLVGAPMAGTGGRVAAFSGAMGVRIRGWVDSPAAGAGFGSSIAVLGDIDGDGIEDFAVGAPTEGTNGVNAGAVFRVSGATQQVIAGLTLLGPTAGGRFGQALAAGGDFDGDGIPDLAIGEPNFRSGPGFVDQGRVRIYPRAGVGAPIAQFLGVGAGGKLGSSVSLNGDFDHDGRADLLAGAPLEGTSGNQRGAAHVYGFAAGPGELGVLTGPTHNSQFGASVAWIKHLNNDARADLAVGCPLCDPPAGTDAGRAFVYLSGLGSAGTGFCFGDGTGTACPCGNSGASGHGCRNSVSTAGGLLTGTGLAQVSADSFGLFASELPPSTSVLFYQGTGVTAGGLGASFGDGLRCVGGSVIRLATRPGVTQLSHYPNQGDVPISLRGSIPVGGGVRRYQAWYRNSAAFCTASTFNLTNGIEVTWLP